MSKAIREVAQQNTLAGKYPLEWLLNFKSYFSKHYIDVLLCDTNIHILITKTIILLKNNYFNNHIGLYNVFKYRFRKKEKTFNR